MNEVVHRKITSLDRILADSEKKNTNLTLDEGIR